jgi:hypothetical protein
MTYHELGSLVVGVDVGGRKKGFHVVALQDGQYRERLSTLIAEEVAAWCCLHNQQCLLVRSTRDDI